MKNQNFSYKHLKNLLEIGHEIEFVYNGVFCSVNNWTDENNESAWFFSTNQKGEYTNTFLAEFDDRKTLLESLDIIKIKEKSLEEIIDKKLYDPSRLTIF
ncbi:hypothetical protein HMPREF0072_1589 [Anaerococcus lactolyticus ATCC 51172]|uniref:Uncharacterized protein n=1 Tax=Anaerococcus lactolyticus ATCC 51172 TaxID=525254 RepID=C2BGW9_9FIRM|nr:hypothetical protein [Anaerococcus lactolyticus]EEI85832.1 hypothetical protein HMPREF0072_1589 [Anaerococcus lactolyticus ATCC 51172]